jgi:hypothetical protein
MIKIGSTTLYKHQEEAVKKMVNGCCLCGGVGTGKSITSYAFYLRNYISRPLYVITTAKKRNTGEWLEDYYALNGDYTFRHKPIIDSWNNIEKYVNVEDAFFIFDEQKAIGNGKWGKTFVKIAKKNKWVILTATPGDNWLDYMNFFIANGIYKNKTDFYRQHVVLSPFYDFPKVDKYIFTEKLIFYRDKLLVNMYFNKPAERVEKVITVDFDKEEYEMAYKYRKAADRSPIKNASELCYRLREIVNADPSRIAAIRQIMTEHDRAIIFYNFDYELDVLVNEFSNSEFAIGQYNGHRHDDIPDAEKWLYFVQYAAGSEGWNCIITNCIIFYSQSYSYKQTEQAMGRIDRLNTPYKNLYYYILKSRSGIDSAIRRCLNMKKDFNSRNEKNMFSIGR